MTEQIQKISETKSAQERSLGDEWEDWDGKGGQSVSSGKSLFLLAAGVAVVVLNFAVCLFVYLISPRLFGWGETLPFVAWILAIVFVLILSFWYTALFLTSVTSKNFLPFGRKFESLFGIIFFGSFRFAKLFGISKDKMGHSFVRSYNDISRATKKHHPNEKLLILLPRCLSKEQLTEINALKDKYPIHIHTVSGGELARKRIKELRPTAVIGVACERDLVSGIRDVGTKISLIGIPNERPEGPCKNTHIDMKELVDAIRFYLEGTN